MSTAEHVETLTKDLAESKREVAELRRIVSRLREVALDLGKMPGTVAGAKFQTDHTGMQT